MYSGVLSPQRGFPSCSAYTSKTAEIASPVVIPSRSFGRTSSGEMPHSYSW
jgi:hypothetical protein